MPVYENLRRRLRGPVYPVMPAFMSSGALDLQGTRDYLDLLIRRGETGASADTGVTAPMAEPPPMVAAGASVVPARAAAPRGS